MLVKIRIPTQTQALESVRTKATVSLIASQCLDGYVELSFLLDQGKSDIKNKIEAGQGSESSPEKVNPSDRIKAGSTTSEDTVGSGSASGVIAGRSPS